jgi:predicted SAM-dependent methyltransferase
MSYIDYTFELLSKYGVSRYNILVICPGFEVPETVYHRKDNTKDAGFSFRKNITTNNLDIDLNDWVDDHLNSDGEQFDLVIASRVLEHLPMRNIDYYLYNLYNIMKKDALLIVTVPDMPPIIIKLMDAYEKETIDYFLINRLNFELFGEGEHHWDFHKTFTDDLSMKHILEREKLFRIEEINHVYIETDIVPPYLEFHARRT